MVQKGAIYELLQQLPAAFAMADEIVDPPALMIDGSNLYTIFIIYEY